VNERHLRAVESRPPTPAELAAERLRALEEFVEKYGIDWWDTHDAPPDAIQGTQLQLVESEAA
jgi:hypothetical protein